MTGYSDVEVPRTRVLTEPASGDWDQTAAESAATPGDYEGRYRTTPPGVGQAYSTVWPTKPSTEDQKPPTQYYLWPKLKQVCGDGR